MLFECEALMMPFFARYDLTDASGYRLRLFFASIYLFKWGDALHVRLEIRGAAAKLFVLWRRAAQSHIPGAEHGERRTSKVTSSARRR